MSTKRRMAAVAVAATAITGAVIAGMASVSASATAEPKGAEPAAVPAAATQTTPTYDRGIVVDVPRDAPTTVDLTRVFRKGTIFSVALYENPSTGYTWVGTLAPGSEPILSFLDTDWVSDPAPSNMVGVGGTRYFRYQAQHRGVATVTFRYQRPWEPDPIRQVTLTVRVK